jgi:hypothetical protein
MWEKIKTSNTPLSYAAKSVTYPLIGGLVYHTGMLYLAHLGEGVTFGILLLFYRPTMFLSLTSISFLIAGFGFGMWYAGKALAAVRVASSQERKIVVALSILGFVISIFVLWYGIYG